MCEFFDPPSLLYCDYDYDYLDIFVYVLLVMVMVNAASTRCAQHVRAAAR